LNTYGHLLGHYTRPKPRKIEGVTRRRGTRGLAQDCVVGPGGRPRFNNFNELNCPTILKISSSHKGQFPELPNRSDGRPRRSAPGKYSKDLERQTDLLAHLGAKGHSPALANLPAIDPLAIFSRRMGKQT